MYCVGGGVAAAAVVRACCCRALLECEASSSRGEAHSGIASKSTAPPSASTTSRSPLQPPPLFAPSSLLFTALSLPSNRTWLQLPRSLPPVVLSSCRSVVALLASLCVRGCGCGALSDGCRLRQTTVHLPSLGGGGLPPPLPPLPSPPASAAAASRCAASSSAAFPPALSFFPSALLFFRPCCCSSCVSALS